ncbi:aldehyde dehydrogenase family protein [Halostagnicola sp. A-GB9-2]|uniref:aldehyde dehydrogenase family protein n=1 Tax=Halostagnicola sp. A-GB9-2 TaxID=3048066 RepID=UPI0024BFDE3E|nr:aldehyde dehydrogenase family protein [Halostagnicola sp. A-GB9-2]MDJ1431706.1 aldehyde dehydrogenase family protein [Halostagnicola sp. A-GB9-2]
MEDITTQPNDQYGSIDDVNIVPETGWNAQYIGGEWRPPGDRETIRVNAPATQSAVGEVPRGTIDDLDEAFKVAEDSQGEWADTPPQERAQIVSTAAQLLEEHMEEFVHLVAIEGGGVRAKGEFEGGAAVGVASHAAGMALRNRGERSESTVPGKENIVVEEPVGVVGVITPWNFPTVLSIRAVAPALALGNSVVLKPDEHTPVTGGLLLGRVFEMAGLPDGVLNVVTGYGDDIGDHFSGHEVPDVISFTGSTEIGRRVATNAVENFHFPALELGGNNAHIVTDDADLELAIEAGAFGSFTHQGQVCISINRHLVHEDVYDDYVAGLAEAADHVPVGDPLEEGSIVGPIINESQFEEMTAYLEETVDSGAVVEAGGDYDFPYVEPTVLSNVTNEMAAACNEHFGPIAPVIPFSSDEEAIELANDTEMGLSGSVHSKDITRARDIAAQMETGMVHINDQPINDDPQAPFGGVKSSGMGRYNDQWIADEFTTTRWISVQHEPREY